MTTIELVVEINKAVDALERMKQRGKEQAFIGGVFEESIEYVIDILSNAADKEFEESKKGVMRSNYSLDNIKNMVEDVRSDLEGPLSNTLATHRILNQINYLCDYLQRKENA